MAESSRVRALVWDEAPSHAPREVYPNSINGAIADGLNRVAGDRIEARVSNLEGHDQGITEEALAETDVLIWWAHARHGEVTDETVERIVRRVRDDGMGFIALHSSHYAKPFKAVIQAHGHLKGGWRENDPPESEEIRVAAPWHPIAEGVPDFTLVQEEYYGAPFDVPPPLIMVFQSHFPLDGRTFPSGLCWTVGQGKTEGFTSGPGKGVGEGEGIGRVFYFRPGHEAFPTYFNPNVQRILANACLWCAKRT
jgi:trehalose utilization protein